MYYYVQRKDSIVNKITETAILEYLDSIVERCNDIKIRNQELMVYYIYSIANSVIKLTRWSIVKGLDSLYNNELIDMYNLLLKEMKKIEEGELIKLMTPF